MNHRHHGEHAVAVWRTRNRKKKKKKRGGRRDLSIHFTDQSEREGFLSHAMQEGGEARHLRAGEG